MLGLCFLAFLPHSVVCLPSFVWGGIMRNTCSQLPLIQHCQLPPSHWQEVALPCLQITGARRELWCAGGRRVMVALKHTDSPLSAKGIVFRPDWRKEGNWRWTFLCSLSIPSEPWLGCPAQLWEVHVQFHDSVSLCEREIILPRAEVLTACDLYVKHKRKVLCGFCESW